MTLSDEWMGYLCWHWNPKRFGQVLMLFHVWLFQGMACICPNVLICDLHETLLIRTCGSSRNFSLLRHCDFLDCGTKLDQCGDKLRLALFLLPLPCVLVLCRGTDGVTMNMSASSTSFSFCSSTHLSSFSILISPTGHVVSVLRLEQVECPTLYWWSLRQVFFLYELFQATLHVQLPLPFPSTPPPPPPPTSFDILANCFDQRYMYSSPYVGASIYIL